MVNKPEPQSSLSPAGELSPAEISRYSRHLVLPGVGQAGQRRLKAASVLVVGIGGLGSPIAMYLTAAGMGRLGLVDFDRVEVTNLQRQIVHSQSTVGMSKVDSAAMRLRGLNPHITIETYPIALTSQNARAIIASYDVIVDGTDNFPARYLLNDACVLLGKPLVYGSVSRFEGQVSVFATPEGPCYRCLLPTPPPPHVVPSCAEAGVLGVLPGTIGALQATEVLKLILGIGDPLIGRLLLYDALDMTFDTIRLPRRPACAVCGEAPTITDLIDYEAFCGNAREAAGAHEGAAGGADNLAEWAVGTIAARLAAGERLLLLDIREPQELAVCRLDGAVHIPMSQIEWRWGEIPRDQPVIVFCHYGIRSARLIRQLQPLGFTNLINMAGGIDAWSQEIDPSIPRY